MLIPYVTKTHIKNLANFILKSFKKKINLLFLIQKKEEVESNKASIPTNFTNQTH